TVYYARPLFFDNVEMRGEKLDRVLARLTQELSQYLNGLARQDRHDELAARTFSPGLGQQRLELTFSLRRRTARCRFLFVMFRQFGRRVVFTPSVPEVWFDLNRGEVLRDRAADVLTRHFRDLERDDANYNPEGLSLSGTASVTPLEIVLHPPAVARPPAVLKFLTLGDDTPMEGATELRRVGRCLDWQYPDNLDRVALRTADAAELTRLLDSGENRPILLLGPSQVGKTALVHEYVFQQVRGRESAASDKRNTWLLAPARLISGMSYVGQWENRLLAILKFARKHGHLLYFDDVLGLFQAGQSSSGSLSVAAILKPYLERRQVRFLGEMTPEAYRILREQDRGFADLFHVLPVSEPSEEDTLRILIAVQRQLEASERCRFDRDVLPTVLDLQRRYGPGRAFPGKAATFLKQLAVKYRGKTVARKAALEEFHVRSGMSVTFLDKHVKLERKEILEALSRQVIGQDAALHAAADIISIAKARLNDPDRPLAAFLFLGPTGVGKTQCAKALAEYLFGSAERLVRFDLNEYGAAGAAARLVGTFSQPEGLLTSALRRQPFAVVLFDEVEKAHPEVFDVLLQVLGEGRLTDALGQTVDFSNALIVLTSNLGVRESESHFGLKKDEAAGDALFVRAAERFFRPEFFNRLDRVLPFRRLAREHIRAIANKLIYDVFHREGLVQRKCILAVEPAALERVVDHGYDPILGARALKRAIERQFTQPISQRLATLPLGGFTAVRVLAGPEQLAVQVHALEQAVMRPQPHINYDDGRELLRRVRMVMQRVENELAPMKPTGPIGSGQLRAEHYYYFTLRDQADHLRDAVRTVADALDRSPPAQRFYPSLRKPDTARRHPYKVIKKDHGTQPTATLLREMAAALNINEYLRELTDNATAVATGPHALQLQELVQQATLLHWMLECFRAPNAGPVLLWLRNLDAEHQDAVGRLEGLYGLALARLRLDLRFGPLPKGCAPPSERFVLIHGPHARVVARNEAGTHLFFPAHAPVEPVQVLGVPLEEGMPPVAALREWQARREAWQEAVGRGAVSVDDDPLRPGPVVRVYDPRNFFVDSLTGATSETSGHDLAACMLAALPLPPEITAPTEEEE
ncbi:MAG TPA: AAA family ATPase, partial [Gemmataceae bacterium]